jgi:hypothetical protein
MHHLHWGFRKAFDCTYRCHSDLRTTALAIECRDKPAMSAHNRIDECKAKAMWPARGDE